MFDLLDKNRLDRTREIMRGERLRKLEFTKAFDDTLSMMALLIDMTASFSSPSEFRRIPNHCGSLPGRRKLDDQKRKNARRRP
jgi:hypothetical protein